MTVRVHGLAAGYGDCLVVEYGRPVRRLLIDAGPKFFWPQVREALMPLAGNGFDVFVVTHIDEDHIGGAIPLLDDPALRHTVRQVWFNGFVHCRDGGSVLGPIQGEQLTERIVTGGVPWNTALGRGRSPGIGKAAVVPSTGDLPVVDLPGGARAVLLSPTGPALKRLADVWEEVVADAGLVAGEGSAGTSRPLGPKNVERPDPPRPLTEPELFEMAADRKRDKSAANASSIAFVLEVEGKRVLLAGDAHGDVLAAGLARYGAQVGESRPRIDLAKLPHHGSGGNVSADLLAAMDCRRYLVSSNGQNYGHPDDAALARLLLAPGRPVTIHTTYDTPRMRAWAEAAAPLGATFVLPRPGAAGIAVRV